MIRPSFTPPTRAAERLELARGEYLLRRGEVEVAIFAFPASDDLAPQVNAHIARLRERTSAQLGEPIESNEGQSARWLQVRKSRYKLRRLGVMLSLLARESVYDIPERGDPHFPAIF